MNAKIVISLLVIGVVTIISFGKIVSLSLFEVSECETFRTEKESTFVRCEMKLCFLNIDSLCYNNVHTYSGFLSKNKTMNGFGQYVTTHWNYTGGWKENKFHGSGTFHFDLGTTSLSLHGNWNHGALEDEAVHTMVSLKSNRTATIYGTYSDEQLQGLVKINVEKTKAISIANTTSPHPQTSSEGGNGLAQHTKEGAPSNQTSDAAMNATQTHRQESGTTTVIDYRCNSTVTFANNLPKGHGAVDCDGLPTSVEFDVAFKEDRRILVGTFVLHDKTEFTCIVGKCLSRSPNKNNAALTRVKTVFEALSDFADFSGTLSKDDINTVDWSKSIAKHTKSPQDKNGVRYEL